MFKVLVCQFRIYSPRKRSFKTSGGFRGGSGGSLEPPSETKLFQFHGEIYEKSGKMLKTNPLVMDLNPTSRNPGSAPENLLLISILHNPVIESFIFFLYQNMLNYSVYINNSIIVWNLYLFWLNMYHSVHFHTFPSHKIFGNNFLEHCTIYFVDLYIIVKLI